MRRCRVVNVFLVAAGIFCFLGMAWLALAMEAHWKQVRKDRLSLSRTRVLRSLGGAALFAALLSCLAADHASMASLVWIMLLAVSSLGVAFTLSWHPRLLSVLVIWAKAAN